MLAKISRLCEPIYSAIRIKLKILMHLWLKSLLLIAQLQGQVKKSEEHLVLLSRRARASDSPDVPITEGLSGDLNTQNVPKSTPERRHVKLESNEEWDKFFKLQNNHSTNNISDLI